MKVLLCKPNELFPFCHICSISMLLSTLYVKAAIISLCSSSKPSNSTFSLLEVNALLFFSANAETIIVGIVKCWVRVISDSTTGRFLPLPPRLLHVFDCWTVCTFTKTYKVAGEKRFLKTSPPTKNNILITHTYIQACIDIYILYIHSLVP